MDLSNAFNNYCITCDKLVGQNFVYCLSQCREKDESQLISILQSCNANIVSPLLTPSLYHQSQHLPEGGVIGLPLLLPESIHSEDVKDFSLNYSVSQPASNQTQTKYGSSTSLNYRLWLTGVL